MCALCTVKAGWYMESTGDEVISIPLFFFLFFFFTATRWLFEMGKSPRWGQTFPGPCRTAAPCISVTRVCVLPNTGKERTDWEGALWKVWAMLPGCFLFPPDGRQLINFNDAGERWPVALPLRVLVSLVPQKQQCTNKVPNGANCEVLFFPSALTFAVWQFCKNDK